MGAITPAIGMMSNVLGTALPVLGAVGQVVNTLQSVTQDPYEQTRKQQDLALGQLKEQQALREQQLAQQTAQEKEKIALQASQDEEARRTALKRAIARQKAQYGSSGVSAGGGSAQAVLLGMFDETEDELAQREALDNLRNKALDSDFENTRSLNLLQSTQLAQRQNLSRLYS